MSVIHQYKLSSGLILLAEPVATARSLAMSLQIPAGFAQEPDNQQGVSAIVEEMLFRGAGALGAKEHSDALDRLGVLRDTHVASVHTGLTARMLTDKVTDALPLLFDMIVRPRLDASVLEPSRDLAIQALDALEDEPQEKVFEHLRRRHWPQPFGRSPLGVREHLKALTHDDVHAFHREHFVPTGSVIGFAGQFDWTQLKDQVEQLLGDWQGQTQTPATCGQPPRGRMHDKVKSTQVHIGLAYDALPEPDDQSLLQKAGIAVLSGGMSGRLFTQVREKRGLCYSVFASYVGHKDRGAVLSYAGTTVPRAKETLEVLVDELCKVSQGVKQDEFDRAIVGMKSRLVMQGESTGARASAIAADQYMRGRPRTLAEWAQRVDDITLDGLNQFLRDHPPGDMTIVTIGPEELEGQG